MTDSLYLLPWVVLAPLLGAPLLAPLGARLGGRTGWVALLFPLLSLAGLLHLASAAGPRPQALARWDWVPALGVEFGLRLDGLSIFFAALVSGMGLLIAWYARFYLGDKSPYPGRFYSYLILFMAAMLGTVLADHLLLLFLFWELTGLASFLLIGFLHEKRDSRIGARQALLVTGGTGLLMLAGILLLGHHTGTYRLSEMLGGLSPALLESPAGRTALLLILAGGFGKSAQFPFFFWLPNAMAAPTPVSAYLHSATMVKLGVFLCARIFPLFGAADLWAPTLLAVGFGTMLLGAFLALRQTDLKAMLAFSTVSQLGFLCGFYGLGAQTGVRFDFLHILNHTLYKGALFMIAGIVDHAAHTRDIRRLGGLGRKMPLLAALTALCAASMAGLPGSLGFISKELALADLFELRASSALGATLALGAFWLSAALNAALAVRLAVGIFWGPPRSDEARHAHAPGLAICLPPLLLAVAAWGFGLAPGALEPALTRLQVAGLQTAHGEHLHLWHGLTRELLLSLAAFGAGIALWALGTVRRWFEAGTPRLLQIDALFERGLKRLARGATAAANLLQVDRPLAYLPITLASALGLIVGTFLFAGLWAELTQALAPEIQAHLDPLRTFIAALIALAVCGVMLLKRWATQLIALSVSGFLVTFYFVVYRAPDLALTQILVETVSLILILLLLGRFPRTSELGERALRYTALRRALNLLLAVGFGLCMTALTMLMTAHPPPDPLGPRFLAATLPLAEGQNAVNTVLVDFRGFDTLGEITVLLIATLGCLGLLLRYKRETPGLQRGAAAPASGGGGKEP